MKTIYKLFFISFCILLTACSNEKNVIQRIGGAGDCISCTGWSWSNGVATSSSTGAFSFVAKGSGELKFSYKKKKTSKYAHLYIYVGNKQYFESGEEGVLVYKTSSIGSIKSGETITFSGREYCVKNIRIIGDTPESDTNINPTDPQWDF